MKAPDHISPSSRRFLQKTAKEFRLSDHHERLLILAAEARDRCEQARKMLEAAGITTTDARGVVRPHPAVAIERDSRVSFVRIIRELGLADDTKDARPPRLTGRYTSRE